MRTPSGIHHSHAEPRLIYPGRQRSQEIQRFDLAPDKEFSSRIAGNKSPSPLMLIGPGCLYHPRWRMDNLHPTHTGTWRKSRAFSSFHALVFDEEHSRFFFRCRLSASSREPWGQQYFYFLSSFQLKNKPCSQHTPTLS